MRRLTILLAALTALMLVSAPSAFAAEKTIVKATGNGSGEVTSGFEGKTAPFFGAGTPKITCTYNGTSTSGVCENTPEEPEEEGAILWLEAHPAPGSEAAGYIVNKGRPNTNGFCSGSHYGIEKCLQFEGEPEEFENFEITAAFCLKGTALVEETDIGGTLRYTFKGCSGRPLTIAKTGEGTITSSPKGIVCTGVKTGAECEHNFEEGSTVTLTASPAAGYAFSAWAGCTEHVGLTCKVTMSKASTVKASFVATPSLTIEKAGSGQGKVGATGISCDENCSKAVSAVKTGTSVTVKTAPAKGSEKAVLEGGTGSASACSGETCTFTISENSSVKVKFAAIPTKTLTVNLTGPAAYKGKVSGKGIVKGLTGAAINCGAGCTSQVESFFSSDEVTLTAVAGTGYTFGGWSVSGGSAGTCTGTTTPCTVKTDADKTISAEFK